MTTTEKRNARGDLSAEAVARIKAMEADYSMEADYFAAPKTGRLELRDTR